MNKVLIDYQEIIDYQILYKMFHDTKYKMRYEKLQAKIASHLNKIIHDNSSKYLMLTNVSEDQKFTRYNTVIVVESDLQKTFNKLISIVESLGTILYFECIEERIDIKIKDGYHLTLFDYTNGVI